MWRTASCDAGWHPFFQNPSTTRSHSPGLFVCLFVIAYFAFGIEALVLACLAPRCCRLASGGPTSAISVARSPGSSLTPTAARKQPDLRVCSPLSRLGEEKPKGSESLKILRPQVELRMQCSPKRDIPGSPFKWDTPNWVPVRALAAVTLGLKVSDGQAFGRESAIRFFAFPQHSFCLFSCHVCLLFCAPDLR